MKIKFNIPEELSKGVKLLSEKGYGAEIAENGYPVSAVKKAGLNGFGKKKSVTARMANLSKAKADEVADACARLGMTTVISEEE